jgi:hypothetical protein
VESTGSDSTYFATEPPSRGVCAISVDADWRTAIFSAFFSALAVESQPAAPRAVADRVAIKTRNVA